MAAVQFIKGTIISKPTDSQTPIVQGTLWTIKLADKTTTYDVKATQQSIASAISLGMIYILKADDDTKPEDAKVLSIITPNAILEIVPK